jgi:hypothetical protein
MLFGLIAFLLFNIPLGRLSEDADILKKDHIRD